MPTFDWVQRDIDTLHAFVLEALSRGRTREDAFKRFAREKGIKSVNSVRYKWITTSPSAAERTGDTELIQAKLQSLGFFDAKASDTASDAQISGTEPDATVSKNMASDCRNDDETDELRQELDRFKSVIGRLRDKNTQLRRENRQLAQNLQAALTKLNPDKPQVVVVVGAEGWRPENLARFIQFTQTESDWSERLQEETEELRA